MTEKRKIKQEAINQKDTKQKNVKQKPNQQKLTKPKPAKGKSSTKKYNHQNEINKELMTRFLKVSGDRIKIQRLLRNVTIEQMSLKTGIKESYLIKIEKGEATRMTLRQFFKIADVLEVLPHEFIKGLH